MSSRRPLWPRVVATTRCRQATELRMGQLPTSLARRGLALPNGLGAHAAVEGQRTLDVSIE